MLSSPDVHGAPSSERIIIPAELVDWENLRSHPNCLGTVLAINNGKSRRVDFYRKEQGNGGTKFVSRAHFYGGKIGPITLNDINKLAGGLDNPNTDIVVYVDINPDKNRALVFLPIR